MVQIISQFCGPTIFPYFTQPLPGKTEIYHSKLAFKNGVQQLQWLTYVCIHQLYTHIHTLHQIKSHHDITLHIRFTHSTCEIDIWPSTEAGSVTDR